MRIILFLSGLLVACGGATETDLFSAPAQSGTDSGLEKDTSVPGTDSGAKDSSPGPDSAIVDANQPDTFMPPTNKIQCGNTPCNNPPDVCCRSGSNQPFTYNCVNDPNTQCAANGDVTIECTNPSDCPNQGEVCCIDLNQQSMAVAVACQPAQQCQGGLACDPKKPNICPNGQSCKLSQFTLPGYYICRN